MREFRPNSVPALPDDFARHVNNVTWEIRNKNNAYDELVFLGLSLARARTKTRTRTS